MIIHFYSYHWRLYGTLALSKFYWTVSISVQNELGGHCLRHTYILFWLIIRFYSIHFYSKYTFILLTCCTIFCASSKGHTLDMWGGGGWKKYDKKVCCWKYGQKKQVCWREWWKIWWPGWPYRREGVQQSLIFPFFNETEKKVCLKFTAKTRIFFAEVKMLQPTKTPPPYIIWLTLYILWLTLYTWYIR